MFIWKYERLSVRRAKRGTKWHQHIHKKWIVAILQNIRLQKWREASAISDPFDWTQWASLPTWRTPRDPHWSFVCRFGGNLNCVGVLIKENSFQVFGYTARACPCVKGYRKDVYERILEKGSCPASRAVSRSCQQGSPFGQESWACLDNPEAGLCTLGWWTSLCAAFLFPAEAGSHWVVYSLDECPGSHFRMGSPAVLRKREGSREEFLKHIRYSIVTWAKVRTANWILKHAFLPLAFLFF